jgi:ATP-binding cassette subfamily B protein
MKDGIHPDYHPIKIVMTDGTEYTTRSTWGKAGDTMQLEVDSKSHPAWTGGHAQLLDRGGRLSRFSNKFGGLIKDEGIKVAKGAPQAPSGKPKAPKPEKPKKPKLKPLLTLLPYLSRYRGRILAAFGALLLASVATLAVPLAVRRMIDFGFAPEKAGTINQYFIALFFLAALLAAASALRFYLVMTLGERVVADIRSGLFAHVIGLSASFYDKERVGEIVSRLTADTTQLKSAAGSSASIALRNLFLFIGAVAMMVVSSPWLSSLVLIAIPYIVLPLVAFGRLVSRRSRAAQDTLANASAFATEAIGAARTLQALTGEPEARRRFGADIEHSFAAARASTKARAWLTFAIIFLVFASVVAVLWSGAQYVMAGKLSAGALTQFVI